MKKAMLEIYNELKRLKMKSKLILQVHDEVLAAIISKQIDLTPAGIIKTLDLRRPIYEKTTAYGHFGRELPEFTWEKTDIKHLFANPTK